MGQAGKALRQVLETYSISQSSLAAVLGVDRPIVFRWFHEHTDPTAETVSEIVKAIQRIEPEASREFIKLYLGDWTGSERQESVVLEPKQLPESDDVNVSALSGLFTDKSTSYKYLFCISLLDILKRRQFEILSPISFYEIVVEMLANAWYPHTYFKLSFGSIDQIAKKLDSLYLEIGEPRLQSDKKLLREAIVSQDLNSTVSHLKRCVPFRLISPFLENELEGVNRGRGNELEYAMPTIANRYFETKKPLYCFDSNKYSECKAIIIHPSWAKYIERNYPVVWGWVAWEWLNYMQQKNPSIPGIVNKLFPPPSDRGKLEPYRKYWKLILGKTEINCIYSNHFISPLSKFHLDHYLPWSFVAHDQPWNLIPIVPEVNSSKSNHIPVDEYFAKFVSLQYLGLSISQNIMGKKQWINYVEPYLLDLKVNDINSLLNLKILKSAYESTLNPLISIATRQGFSRWSYR